MDITRILLAVLMSWLPIAATHAAPVGYAFTITTAYATSNPFPNRADHFYIEPDTGFLQIANVGDSSFTGTLGTIAVSAFAGDLSFTLPNATLMPGQTLSIAMAFDASDVGGYNGPAYFYRPGIQIYLTGRVTDATGFQDIDLLVADRDIHSGVFRFAPSGLLTDSFVLQGGDPWGFDPGDAFELSQANGVFVFRQDVPEPALSAAALGLLTLVTIRSQASRGCGHRRRVLRQPASTGRET